MRLTISAFDRKGRICSYCRTKWSRKDDGAEHFGGMDTATSGKLIVDGQDITSYDSKKLTGYRRDDIGFVFQFYNLVPNLTAVENVELALQICKDPLDAETVLEEVGLGKG